MATNAANIETIPIYCKCGEYIGRMQQGDKPGVIYLVTPDHFSVRLAKRCCPVCGKWFHFSPPAKPWGVLYADYQKRIGNNGHKL